MDAEGLVEGCTGLEEGLREGVEEGVLEGVRLGVELVEVPGLGVTLEEVPGLGVTLVEAGLGVVDGETPGEDDGVRLRVGVTEGVLLGVREGVTEGVRLGVAVGDGLKPDDGLGVGDPRHCAIGVQVGFQVGFELTPLQDILLAFGV